MATQRKALRGTPFWREYTEMDGRLQTAVALGFAVGLLAACGGNSKPSPTDPGYIGQQGRASSGSMPGGSVLGDSSLVFGTAKDRPGGGTGGGAGGGGGGALGVNAYLWRGALDTLSFMPLSSADPFGGVIITDWYTPTAANDERFKATAYILGRELRSDGGPGQHLPPGAAERPMGGCAGEPGHRRRDREQGAVACPRIARAVAGEQLAARVCVD